MPILILLGIGVFCGIAAAKENLKPSRKYDINMSPQEKTAWVLEMNKKRIEKIMRKYGGRR